MENELEIISPFFVFISSSITEFEKLRKNLKSIIDGEKFVTSQCRPMKAILIEQQRGPVILEEIKNGLKKCSIYVGIFGSTYSNWTIAEYCEARSVDVPLLIYHIKKRRRPGRPPRATQRGRRSKVEEFLDNEVKRFGFRIRGP